MTSTVPAHPRPLSLSADPLVRLHATLAHRGHNALGVATARLDALEPLIGAEALSDVRHAVDQFGEWIERIAHTCRPLHPRRRSLELRAWTERWCRRTSVPFVHDGGEATTTTDPELLGAILAELVANALQHAHDPSVHLHATAGRLEVHDRGPGVPDEHRPFLGEPFFTTSARSLGLGLHRARRLAAALQASLTFAPLSDGGWSAVLALPPTNEEAQP